MGVYIKGMEMPKSCDECPINDDWRCLLRLNTPYEHYIDSTAWTHRMRWCPLVEIPVPHGRLVDADALANDLDYDATHYEEDHEMKSNCAAWLRSNATPTVIEAEEE